MAKTSAAKTREARMEQEIAARVAAQLANLRPQVMPSAAQNNKAAAPATADMNGDTFMAQFEALHRRFDEYGEEMKANREQGYAVLAQVDILTKAMRKAEEDIVLLKTPSARGAAATATPAPEAPPPAEEKKSTLADNMASTVSGVVRDCRMVIETVFGTLRTAMVEIARVVARPFVGVYDAVAATNELLAAGAAAKPETSKRAKDGLFDAALGLPIIVAVSIPVIATVMHQTSFFRRVVAAAVVAKIAFMATGVVAAWRAFTSTLGVRPPA